VFGQLGGSFQQFFLGNFANSTFHHRLNQLTLYFLYLGIGQFTATYIAVVGFMYTGEHITQKLREQYLAAILRQNIAIYDTLGAGEITSTITANMDLVLLGVSEKIAITITALTTFVTALIVGFTKNWRLSFVLLSVVFAVLFVMVGFSVFIVRYNKATLDAYAPGSAVAEEAFTSIRTVTAFNGQHKLASKYEESLNNTMHWGFRMKTAVGCMIGSMILVTYLAYALGFWEGSRLLVAGHANLSQTLTVLLALLTGAVSIAHAAPHIQAFAGAISAAANIFKIIDRPAPDDQRSVGLKPEKVEGALEFRNIKHVYPSRPEVTVLEDFNLVVPAGKVTALVGASGSGKSTIVGLVERFYTPVGGQVLLDGHDTQSLDLKWLRQQMSLVSQEPVLFNCSIRANIEHGMSGKDLESVSEEKKAELVTQAAKIANAHDFITGLPKGYETVVGDRGLLLSGGQKQRISIARAIISNPKILLLDEATSALDSQSEGVVQAALDVASQGRTTIVIAHRLSTIKDADNIVVLGNGQIVEQGSHDGLLSRKDAYFDLVEAQRLTADKTAIEPSHQHDAGLLPSNEDTILSSGYVKKDLEAGVASTASSIATQRAPSEGSRDSLWTIIKLIAAFNKNETGIMLLGLVFSILAGGGMPVQGVIFAKCIVSLSLPSTHYTQLRSDLDYWSLVFLAVALTIFIVSSGHGVAFAYCSERLYVLFPPPLSPIH
jgi:ATP-binding cassette subfamily B (MDR/TAP) protein 1